MKFSRALINAGETAAKAAKAKNVDAVSDAGNDVYETCDGCHKQYLKR
jgi:cytochrome c556